MLDCLHMGWIRLQPLCGYGMSEKAQGRQIKLALSGIEGQSHILSALEDCGKMPVVFRLVSVKHDDIILVGLNTR